jgi:hypothetical protein
MNQLTNLTLFSLLSESIENNGYQKKLEEAYVEFINEILHLYQVENDILSIIRTLNLTYIEFIVYSFTIKSIIRGGGKMR